MAVIDPDAPVPADRFLRRPKRRLRPHPDPRRFDAAAEIFRLRIEEHAGDTEIRYTLTARPDLYPNESGWTNARISGLLANPKLSGRQVYGRKHTRSGRRYPIAEWVWSPEPVHTPVVSLEEWVKAQAITAKMRRPVNGLDRLREAAHARGLSLRVIDSSVHHFRYSVGDQDIIVHRSSLDSEDAEEIIADIL